MISGFLSLYFASILHSIPQAKVETQNQGATQFQNILSVAPVPEAKVTSDQKNIPPPKIQANAYVIMDLRSGKMLGQKSIGERRSIGSITKLITALIILDENNLNDIVTVPDSATKVEGSRIWLASGEKITVRDLLSGLLIHSGNDAAYTLAIFNAGSVDKFVGKMNEKAKKLGLNNTHFGNPAGLDHSDNYSTAEDIALLGSYAYRNSFIRYTVGISKTTVSSVNGKFKHELENTNILLVKDPRFKGLKTGHTLEAGYSFVGVATLPNNNASLLTVVLDSPDRFKESIALVDWAASNFNW